MSIDFYPIGTFDSGIDELIVMRVTVDQFPEGSITYIGSTAHTPYEPEPTAQACELVLDIMSSLVDSSIRMLVIAYGSASAAVLHDARERYRVARSIPVVEVIQPTVRCAASTTRNRRIGVIGTEATIGSDVHKDTFAVMPYLTLMTAACPKFVELAEAGVTVGPQIEGIVECYPVPVCDVGADTLVFGYTHYPSPTGATGYTMGGPVALVSSADETARDVYAKLASRGLFAPPGNEPDHRFYATEDLARFSELAGRFLGPEIGMARSISQISSGVSA